MKKKIRIIVVIASIAFLCAGSYLFYRVSLRPPLIAASSRTDWIEQAQSRLLGFKPSVLDRGVKFEIYSDDKSYIVGHGSLIRAKDGGWLYFLMHSFHQDEKRMGEQYGKAFYSESFRKSDKDTNAYIGDIVLVVDSDRHLYWSDAHPCLGIKIVPTNKKPFQAVNEFPSSREFIDESQNPTGKTWNAIEWGNIPNKASQVTSQ